MQQQMLQIRQAQTAWSRQGVRSRLPVLRATRTRLARESEALAATVHAGSGARTVADTLVAEVLPLAEACRFLEQEAEFILRRRRLGPRGRPLWLHGVQAEVERVPLGVVLVIAPGNYPLFLPGVQALQALAAGNAVLWKPAPGGAECARALQAMLTTAGLPDGLLTVLDDTVAAAEDAIDAGVDKVVLTGSAETGGAVLRRLAATATPSIMELSGCDAVFVLEGADLGRAVDALAFGMRLNGSATCMAPRRVLAHRTVCEELAQRLSARLRELPPAAIAERTARQLSELVDEATREGAVSLLRGPDTPVGTGVTLLTGVTPQMRVARSDVFAPVLSMMRFDTLEHAIDLHEQCPLALTAAIFGPPQSARLLAQSLTAGTVLFEDLIVSTADPRVPFGGRKASGFGVTRGREGLLEMTASRTLLRQRSRGRVAYAPTGEMHAALFAGYLQAAHGSGWRARLHGLRAMGRAATRLRSAGAAGLLNNKRRNTECV